MLTLMKMTNRYLVYPEDETMEIEHSPQFDDMVDLNGRPLALPLKTHRIIAYRVYKIRKEEKTGEENIYYHLELMSVQELEGLVR